MAPDQAAEHLSVDEVLSLTDWRRRVSRLYEDVRTAPDPAAAWGEWRAVRDELFASHPQSPLPQDGRAEFLGLDYYDYRPDARVLADLRPAAPTRVQIAASAGGTVRPSGNGRVRTRRR